MHIKRQMKKFSKVKFMMRSLKSLKILHPWSSKFQLIRKWPNQGDRSLVSLLGPKFLWFLSKIIEWWNGEKLQVDYCPHFHGHDVVTIIMLYENGTYKKYRLLAEANTWIIRMQSKWHRVVNELWRMLLNAKSYKENENSLRFFAIPTIRCKETRRMQSIYKELQRIARNRKESQKFSVFLARFCNPCQLGIRQSTDTGTIRRKALIVHILVLNCESFCSSDSASTDRANYKKMFPDSLYTGINCGRTKAT